jgi:hypothetical protein
MFCTLLEGQMRNAYKILVGKPGGKRTLQVDLGEDGKIILEWIGWGGLGCVKMAQDRDQRWDVEDTVMNLRIP